MQNCTLKNIEAISDRVNESVEVIEEVNFLINERVKIFEQSHTREATIDTLNKGIKYMKKSSSTKTESILLFFLLFVSLGGTAFGQDPLGFVIPNKWEEAGYLETQPGLYQKAGFQVPNGNISLRNYYSVANNTFEMVEDGEILDGVEMGGSWTSGPGYVEQTGTGKFLAAPQHTFIGGLVFAAKLSLATLNHTAASFAFGTEHFGFDGGGNRFFTEGVVWGSPQFHGPASAYITPRVDFVLKVVWRFDKVSFYIDDNLIVTRDFDNSTPVDFIALRPWRNTMRVKTFRTLGGGFNELGTIVSPYTYSAQFNLSLPNSVLGFKEIGVVSVDAQDPDSFEEFVLDAYAGN